MSSSIPTPSFHKSAPQKNSLTMPEITCDKDLPKIVDAPTKQVKWAKKLALIYLGSPVDRVDKPPMQGMFSRTLFLTLKDKREIVQQFRTEPLDLNAFRIARRPRLCCT